MSADTDYKVLRQILNDHVDELSEKWAAEFGVYSGKSLRIIASRMQVVGFDSFQGLPEDWRPGFPQGKFDDLGVIPQGHAPDRAMIVPGWFEDTAPKFPFPPLALVHIDCDLYSSTVTALDAVRPYISEGTIFVFDEYEGYEGWEQHEAKAWQEFIAKHRIICRSIAQEGEERAFLVTFIGGED